MDIQIIGDEIHFNGYVVGALAKAGVPATIMADLLEWLDDVGRPTLPRAESYDKALADVELVTKRFGRGGFLRLSDLDDIIAQLKKGTQ